MLHIKQFDMKHKLKIAERIWCMEQVKIGLELRSLNNMIRRYFVFAAQKNGIGSVTGNNEWIIGYLTNNEDRDIYQKDIEDYFTITRSTASKVLRLMEKKGLIQRQAVTHDARLKKVMLTEKASDISEVMLEDGKKLERNLVRGFREDEVAALLSYIKRMKENISNTQEKN